MERLRITAGVGLFLAAGMMMAFYPTLFSGFRLVQSGVGDTRFNGYVLEHEYRRLAGISPDQSFWDPPMFYPARNTLAYSDVLLTVAPFYWVFRVFGFAPDTSFQWWTLVMGLLNYLAGYVLFRRCFGRSPQASALGAFLVAFGSPRISQLAHHQLLPHFFTLGAIASLIEFFRRGTPVKPGRKRLWLCLFFAFTAAQIYAGFYFGYFLLFVLLASLAWTLALRPYRAPFLCSLRRHPWALALCGAASLAALSPLAWHYLSAAGAVGARGAWAGEQWLPRLQSWIYLGGRSWVYGWMSRIDLFSRLPMEETQSLGLGFLTTALAVAGLFRHRKDPIVRLIAFVALTVIVSMTMFPGGVRLWRVLYYTLPGIQGLRAICRIGILLLIPAGLGVALFLDSVTGPRKRALALALGGLCCIEQGQGLRFYDKQNTREDVSRLAGRIDPGCTAFLYVAYQERGPVYKLHLDAMWAGLEAGVPAVNGYSGNTPPDWPFGKIKVNTRAGNKKMEQSLLLWLRSNGAAPEGVCVITDAPAAVRGKKSR